MKHPEWKDELVRWDQWKQFHIGVNSVAGLCATSSYGTPPFIWLDSGELICTDFNPDTKTRGWYRTHNIELVATSDRGCPQFWTPCGVKVARAWLDNSGQQRLLIDHCTGKAVALAHRHNETFVKVIPEKFSYPDNRAPAGSKRTAEISAYFAGPGCDPVGGPVFISAPNKVFCTAEELTHITHLRSTCRAGMSLMGEAPSPDSYTRPLLFETAMRVKTYAELDECGRKALYLAGVGRKKMSFPYLLTREP